eukprot:CAMPEP_0185340018 /NCGR_PEP_ID=MMETSP1363-20130426/97915_1 /TAXON_ID=38817 /ORGANISM="Gephyrocapsa oceanica, Strain RCC1303" /LENGTH=379 /DNA_ID=CAMNT_0027939245 /DNA_START=74 /DNA_END=1213 /DNA_ORIENTATION=+
MHLACLLAVHGFTVLVHVGPTKTGTKTVQNRLAELRPELSAHNIWDGTRYRDNSTQRIWAAFDLGGYLKRCPTLSATVASSHFHGYAASLLPPASSHVVLSSEGLSDMGSCSVLLRDLLRPSFDRVHIVTVYRNARARAESRIMMNVRYGKESPLGVIEAVKHGCHSFANHPADKIEGWFRIFGREHVSVVDFDGVTSSGGDLGRAVLETAFPNLTLSRQRKTKSAENVTPERAAVLRGLWYYLEDHARTLGTACRDAVSKAKNGVFRAHEKSESIFDEPTPVPSSQLPQICDPLENCSRLALERHTRDVERFGDVFTHAISKERLAYQLARATRPLCTLDIHAFKRAVDDHGGNASEWRAWANRQLGRIVGNATCQPA